MILDIDEVYLDALEKELHVGDTIVYGKSNRDNPITHGVIQKMFIESYINYKEGKSKFSKYIKVKGRNNQKAGDILLSTIYSYNDNEKLDVYNTYRVYLLEKSKEL
jgi:hypothetical protein